MINSRQSTHMKKLFFLILFFISFSTLLGQTYSDNEDVIEKEANRLDILQNDLNLLGINNQTNSKNENLEGNRIVLKQVGDFNIVAVNNTTQASEIKIAQFGERNLTNLSYVAKTSYTDLIQNGNYNTIKDYSYDLEADISLELQQQGNGLYFERFGTNSITESLKFKQTSASPTIIIRSFQ